MSGTLHLSGALQVGSLAAAPSNPEVGFQYYDSVLGKYRQWDGAAWVEPANIEDLSSTSNGEGASTIGIEDSASNFTSTDVEGVTVELYDLTDTAQSAADLANSNINSHEDGSASKHDASEIDVEAADGKNHSAGSAEAVIGALDDAIGALAATPSNYTPTSSAIVADHLSAIDTALSSAGGTSFDDDTFEVKDNVDASKKITLQASAITTATTRTITMADADVDLADISTNASNISTNTGNIGTNTSNIGTNTTNIGTNSSNISTLQTFDTDLGSTVNAKGASKVAIEDASSQFTSTNVEGALDESLDAAQAAQVTADAAIPSSQKGSANGVATLGADSKIPSAQLPAIAITDTFVVASEVAMLALTVETGDVAVRTDENKSYILKGTDGSLLADWEELLSPTAPITTVNGQTGVVVLDSDDISEGSSNLYFTDSRAKSAAVSDSITDAVTDVAPSQNAVFDALAPKLENVSEDSTPSLGGDLTLGSNVVIHDADGMKRGSSNSAFITEEYVDSIALVGSQTGSVISDFTFAHATYSAIEIVYIVKETTSNDIKQGTLRVVSNGSAISHNDLAVQTADTGIVFSAAINGSNVEVKYDSGSNGATMRADVKKIKAI